MSEYLEKVNNVIKKYDVRNIKTIVQEALDNGVKAQSILDDAMIPAMDEIGADFKANKVFMPQMLMAAKTMQFGLDVLKPQLAGDPSAKRAGKAVIGSVEGDVHDIGKNLVSIMLGGAGLDVTDLGVDVPASKFMEALDSNPDTRFVAISSTMTPTREALRSTVAILKGSKHADDVVMVGGATMDQQFSTEIGADIYTADAASAAQRAKQIISGEDVEKVKAESVQAAEVSQKARESEPEESAEKVDTAGGKPRHLLEPKIRTVGHGDRKPLSVIENFEETMKHGDGCPDRYVNQYEFIHFVDDPVFVHSKAFNECRPGATFKDGWGVTQEWPVGAGGEHPIYGHGKTVLTDITKWEEQVKIPKVETDPALWAHALEQKKEIIANGQMPCLIMAPGVFERLHELMGMEETLTAFFEHPEEMHDLIDAITDWEVQSIKANMENYGPRIILHHDDWGSNLNSFLDEKTQREFFLEPYKRIYGTFRELGGEYVIHHSDGYAANLVPFMIDVGIDIWQATTYYNHIPDIIDRYGDRFCIMGGIEGSTLDVPNWDANVIDDLVQKMCDENGTTSYIPCMTYGAYGSIYPGVYEEISKSIDKASKRKF